MRHAKHMLSILAVMSTVLCVQLLTPASAIATDTTKFKAGRIVDDTVFTNYSSMGPNEIQVFLSSKVPNCDTNGNQRSEMNNTGVTDYNGDGIIQRWEWGKAKYGQTSFPCLKDYSENGNSAAKIIHNAALQYRINPQILIVLLQKEQGLITDTWPLLIQYKSATGYGCPDTAPCDEKYFGLTNQLNNAANMFNKIIISDPNWYTPYVLGNNNIQWSPNISCGTGPVNIENRATQALYNYTPYQPNQAALSAEYGTGDSCSSYGNRNFYLYFTDWFGSTYGDVQIVSPLKMTSSVAGGNYTNRQLSFSYSMKNTSSARIDIGDMIIATRDANNNNYDFGRQSITIGPGQTYNYIASTELPLESTYTFAIGNYRESVGWSSTYPTSAIDTLTRANTSFIQAIPTVTASPSLSDEARVGRVSWASFSMKNNSARPLNIGKLGLAVRGPQNQNMDLPYDSVGSIAAGETYQYRKSFAPSIVGNYSITIASTNDNGISWTSSNFPDTPQGFVNNLAISAKQGVTITQGLPTPATYKVGQKVILSFKITNYTDSTIVLDKTGLYIRSPSGDNYDPWWELPTIQPRTTHTYSIDLYPESTGNWTVGIGGFRSGAWTSSIFPLEDNSIRSTTNITVLPNPIINEGISLNPTDFRSGRPATVQFKVKNDGDKAVTLELIGLSVRGPNNENLDPGWESPTIAPRTTYTYSRNITFQNTGTATVAIGGKKNGQWVSNPLPLESNIITVSHRPKVLPGITLKQGVTIEGPLTVGSHALSIAVTNYTSNTINLGKLGIAVRDPSGANYDPFWQEFIVDPNSTRTYTATVNVDKPGTWTAQVGNYNGTWNSSNPPSEDSSVQRLVRLNFR